MAAAAAAERGGALAAGGGLPARGSKRSGAVFAPELARLWPRSRGCSARRRERVPGFGFAQVGVVPFSGSGPVARESGRWGERWCVQSDGRSSALLFELWLRFEFDTRSSFCKPFVFLLCFHQFRRLTDQAVSSLVDWFQVSWFRSTLSSNKALPFAHVSLLFGIVFAAELTVRPAKSHCCYYLSFLYPVLKKCVLFSSSKLTKTSSSIYHFRLLAFRRFDSLEILKHLLGARVILAEPYPCMFQTLRVPFHHPFACISQVPRVSLICASLSHLRLLECLSFDLFAWLFRSPDHLSTNPLLLFRTSDCPSLTPSLASQNPRGASPVGNLPLRQGPSSVAPIGPPQSPGSSSSPHSRGSSSPQAAGGAFGSPIWPPTSTNPATSILSPTSASWGGLGPGLGASTGLSLSGSSVDWSLRPSADRPKSGGGGVDWSLPGASAASGVDWSLGAGSSGAGSAFGGSAGTIGSLKTGFGGASSLASIWSNDRPASGGSPGGLPNGLGGLGVLGASGAAASRWSAGEIGASKELGSDMWASSSGLQKGKESSGWETPFGGKDIFRGDGNGAAGLGLGNTEQDASAAALLNNLSLQ